MFFYYYFFFLQPILYWISIFAPFKFLNSKFLNSWNGCYFRCLHHRQDIKIDKWSVSASFDQLCFFLDTKDEKSSYRAFQMESETQCRCAIMRTGDYKLFHGTNKVNEVHWTKQDISHTFSVISRISVALLLFFNPSHSARTSKYTCIHILSAAPQCVGVTDERHRIPSRS